MKAMSAFYRTKLGTLAFGGLIGLLSTVLVSCRNGSPKAGGAAEATFVAVTQIVDRQELDAIRDGVKDELTAAGYEEGKTLRWEWRSAKGSPMAATHIANKYANAQPDVIVAISTPSAKKVAAATTNTPIIFSAVSDPIGAKLIKNTKRPSKNISGVDDSLPIKQQLKLIQEVLPEIKTLGIISSVDQAVVFGATGKVNEYASDLDIDIEEIVVIADSDVAGAALILAATVDAIYIPTNKTVEAALASVIQVGKDNQVPVFAGNTDAVKEGAIATISFDYYEIGRQTGAMVVKVLRGTRPSDLAVEFVKELKLSINLKAAESMGVVLPRSVVLRADEIL